mmetsp:Transcript_16274/g.23635  ORF Transcript_16274/g.23635 Transcript_16274/m.23635 type:complete len:84 (-) Transcript_16274:61-312(-)
MLVGAVVPVVQMIVYHPVRSIGNILTNNNNNTVSQNKHKERKGGPSARLFVCVCVCVCVCMCEREKVWYYNLVVVEEVAGEQQ